ncbi:MAG: hypothetical protein ACO1PI_15770 [Bacteroidota bacterium]
MEYLKIVLEGYINPNTINSLSNYFFREFKKAEKEYYDINEFFEGCLGIVRIFEDNLQNRLYKRKNELYLMKGLAEDGELNYPETDPNLSIKQRRENSIKYAKEELERIKIDDFYLNLSLITKGQYIGQMSNNQITFISSEINKAYLKALNHLQETQKNKELADGKGQTQINKIQAPVIALFCSLVNDSTVLKREYDETIANYCKRVCSKYILPYSERVRQCFSDKGTRVNKKKVKDLILPLIDAETAALITKYMENIK